MVTNMAYCGDNSAFGKTFSVKGNVFFTERIGIAGGRYQVVKRHFESSVACFGGEKVNVWSRV